MESLGYSASKWVGCYPTLPMKDYAYSLQLLMTMVKPNGLSTEEGVIINTITWEYCGWQEI